MLMRRCWTDCKMNIKKGEIYLANLGNRDSFDIGKIRPVVVFQNNMLNKMIERTAFRDLIVLPLSSQIRENEFSYFLKKQENLEKDSVILCNAIKMIDANRLIVDKGVIAVLNSNQIVEIEKILYKLFDCRV